MRPLVVTGCTEKFEWPARNFLNTLLEAGRYRAKDLLFIDYGVSDAMVDTLYHYGFDRIPVDTSMGFIKASNLAKGLVARYLECNPQYTHVLVADAGDVWFQKPLDDLWPLVDDAIGMVSQPMKCGDSWFRRQVLMFDEEHRSRLESVFDPAVQVKNCGIIAGPRTQVKRLFNLTYLEISQYSHFAADQVYINFIAQRKYKNIRFVELPCTYNYMPMCFPWSQVNGKLIMEDGQPATICHNAGHRLFHRGEGLNVENEYNV